MANENELEDCPFCPNQGWYPDYDRNGEVVQVQCEFCWTNPLSKFNAPNTACTGQLAGAGKAEGESTPSANCQ